MVKIYRPKGESKTLELIKISHHEKNHIVCYDMKAANMIESWAKELGYSIPFPITYYEFVKGDYYDKNIRGFLIDNAEALLQYMTRVKIEVIAITVDWPEEKTKFSVF